MIKMNAYEQQQYINNMTSILYDTIARKEKHLERLCTEYRTSNSSDIVDRAVLISSIKYLEINIDELYKIYEDLRKLMED